MHDEILPKVHIFEKRLGTVTCVVMSSSGRLKATRTILAIAALPGESGVHESQDLGGTTWPGNLIELLARVGKNPFSQAWLGMIWGRP